jgi:hypothetical protein
MKLSTKETLPILKCEKCNLLFSDCTLLPMIRVPAFGPFDEPICTRCREGLDFKGHWTAKEIANHGKPLPDPPK